MASWVSSAISTIASHAGSAVSAVAGCTASAVVEKIVEVGMSFLSKHMLSDNSEAVLTRVQMALPQIRAVMGVAEALKVKDPGSSEWVEQFRQAVDAAEDVLDELEYKKLEDMVKHRDEAEEPASGSKKRKTCTTSISDDILERLKKAITMLDQVAATVERLLQLAIALGISSPLESQLDFRKDLRRESTSLVAEREVFGREIEKEKIINWLKQPTRARLSSFGIVGVGGIGKTTLAQFAYQEMRKSDYFEKMIWVSVSTDFSVEDITIKILSKLGESGCGNNSLNVLQENLNEKLLSKKILLILDDVWEDEKRGEWEQLIAPLRFVQQGSKILFTTRLKSVADLLASVTDTEHEYLALQDLGENDLQLLFNSYAFHGFNPSKYRDLQAIGDHIVKMLRGSPLAAKMIGSLLNSHMNQPYWRRISKHDSLINLDEVKDVMEILKLSYYNLPTDLQVCFRFFSMFPQDYLFDKKELIEMWMASGFIPERSCQEEKPEDIGEDYFNHFLGKSFLEHSHSSHGRYVMHDLMHELARNISNGECYRVTENNKSITIPSTVRHVSIPETEIQMVSHLENIRSLLITTCEIQIGADPNLFILPNKLMKKTLRLLKIYKGCSCVLPEEMSCLLHLRYLSIGSKDVYQSFKYLLPASIDKLYHLQILEFVGASNESFYSGIEKARMANLVNLRYMRLPYRIKKTICGVHWMTSLQELTFFVGHESGYRINELSTLNNLTRLTIYNTENIGDPAEAKAANILGKKSLRSLSLTWTSKSKLNKAEKIIDNLLPHPNLLELKIENYKGQRSPTWMSNTPPLNLSSLKLYRCRYLNKQPIFGQLPHLKVLHIYECPNLDKLPDMPISLTEFRIIDVGLTSLPYLYQSFGTKSLEPLSLKSSLRAVRIMQCRNLKSLNGFLQQGTLDLQGFEELTIGSCRNLAQLPINGFKTFVSLKYLCIGDCPNVTRLPCLPRCLITFEIYNMAIRSLPEYFGSPSLSSGPSTSLLESSLREVYITKCRNITALNGFLQQENIDFQSINKIYIKKCEQLAQIPIGAFQKFVSLVDLTIEKCPKLMAVDNKNNLLPSKLKRLSMMNCGELDVPLLESASILTTVTDLIIGDCANITRIPSSENVFGSLCKLSISGCGKLIAPPFTQQAHNFDQGSNCSSFIINDLFIGHLSFLLIEPLRSLKSVSVLQVGDCSGMEALPEQWLLQNSSCLRRLLILNASTLQSLPANMSRLAALEELRIENADFLVELPELPASLKNKCIYGSGNRRL